MNAGGSRATGAAGDTGAAVVNDASVATGPEVASAEGSRSARTRGWHGASRRWRSIRWPAGVFGVALAGAFAIYARIWADPFRYAPGGRGHYNDPMQAMWNLKWVPWQLLHGHDPFGTDAIYYPHGVSLSWNTLMPTLGVLAAPLTLTLGAAFAFAVLLVLGPATASLTGFLWLRRHTTHPLPAAVGGLLIGFNPFMTGHIQGQINLTCVALIPLLLMLVEDLLWRHPRTDRASAIWLGVFGAAQAGISEELLLITAIAVLVALGWAVLTQRVATLAALRRAGPPFGLAVLVFLVLASPLLVHQLFVSQDVGLRATHWRALIGDYLEPLGGQAITAKWPHLTYLGGAEDGVYLGPLMLAVLVIGLILTVRRDRGVRLAAAVLVVMVIFTFGDAHPLGVPLPWHWFGELPVLRSVLPGRFSFASWLAIAWLLAHWLDALSIGALRRETRRRVAAVPALIGILAIVAALITIVPRNVAASRLPDAPFFHSRRELTANLPNESSVYLLPSPTFNDASGMYFQQLADFRFDQPGGYALRPDRGGAAYGPPDTPLIALAKLAGLNAPLPAELVKDARAQLRAEHFRAVVVVLASYRAGEFEHLARALTGHGPDRVTGGVELWFLHP